MATSSTCLRKNNATSSTFNRRHFVGAGTFMNVYKEKYTDGERKGQAAVAKVFKSGSVFERAYFDHEMQVVDNTVQIVNAYNAGSFVNRKIRVNDTEIWKSHSADKELSLAEPFIENFEKFNSNSGWVSRDRAMWNLVMQSLSHFSYDHSRRQLVLCDLQGGIYKDGAILTDPVIVSKTGCFGPTDLGIKGIDSFFAGHTCNQYCRASWLKPNNPIPHFPVRQGTSMISWPAVIPTRSTRSPMSAFA